MRDYVVHCYGRMPCNRFEIGALLYKCCCMQVAAGQGKPSQTQVRALRHVVKGSTDIALDGGNVQWRTVCRLLRRMHEANLLLGSGVHSLVCAANVLSRFGVWDGVEDRNTKYILYDLALRRLIDLPMEHAMRSAHRGS